MEQSLDIINTDNAVLRAEKVLRVPFLTNDLTVNEIQLSEIMDRLPREQISNTSWPEYETACKTEFCIAYTNDVLLLKYYIKNDYFKSEPRNINGPVHFDNCVEFFVRFNNEPGYYNIEFNCLGIGKVAYGRSNSGRKFITEGGVKSIKTLCHQKRTGNGFDWEMILMIPVKVFQYSYITLNQDLECSANFYKCGDHLPKPHYLTWNRIEATKPNFHSPQFFGKIMFSGVAESISADAVKGRNIFL